MNSLTLKLNCRLFCLGVLVVGMMLFAGRAGAQNNDANRARIAAMLPAESQAVVTRLSALREMPDGAWKMHAGDLAHGEAAGLDLGGWEPIAQGGKAPNDAVWFRQTYTIPETLQGYDLTGARIWFEGA